MPEQLRWFAERTPWLTLISPYYRDPSRPRPRSAPTASSAIAEVQVVAAPDERYREVACAYVMLRPGASLTLDDMIEHCYGRVASYKIPRYLRIVEEWPMSGTRIQKFRLRERIAAELNAEGVRSAPKLSAPRP